MKNLRMHTHLHQIPSIQENHLRIEIKPQPAYKICYIFKLIRIVTAIVTGDDKRQPSPDEFVDRRILAVPAI